MNILCDAAYFGEISSAWVQHEIRLHCEGRIRSLLPEAAVPASNMTVCRELCPRATGWTGVMYGVNPLRFLIQQINYFWLR